MIVDIKQDAQRNRLEVSYVTDDGTIDFISRVISPTKWIITDDDDPLKSDKFKNWDGSPVKQIKSKYFGNADLREYLTQKLDQETKDKIFKFNRPKVTSVDIEVDIRKIDSAFPEAHLAEAPVNLITMTSENLNTVAFALRSDRHHEEEGLEKRLNDRIYGHLFNSDGSGKTKKLDAIFRKLGIKKPKVKVIWFDSEEDLLKRFFLWQKKAIHTSIWWNNENFDTIYLHERAKKLKIDRGAASPTSFYNKYSKPYTQRDKYKKRKTKVYKPLHRLEVDYMELVDHFCVSIFKTSLKLDYIAKELLGIGKVEYDGSFYDLLNYESNETFLFYGCIDTITVMLIHLGFDYLNTALLMTYTARIPLGDFHSTTKLGSALFFDEFYDDNCVTVRKDRKKDILLEDEKASKAGGKGTYEGGYVVDPRVALAIWAVFLDFKSLYPASMQALGCSPELIKKINATMEEIEEALKNGDRVSMNGTIYDGSRKGVVFRVINKLIYSRYHYKSLMMWIFKEVLPIIETEMKRRGISLD